MNKNIYKLFTLSTLLLLSVLATAFYKDNKREWKKYQMEFYKRSSQFAKTKEEKELIKNTPLSIKQIIIPELNKVDRCITCHLGVEEPDFKGEEQPYSYHEKSSEHPYDKFGCTICHQGQGMATTKDAAHGKLKFVETPLLKGEYIKSSCGKCHIEGEIRGAEEINLGKKLFEKKGCRGCHKLGDRGGNIGPDLTYIGRPGYRDVNHLFQHFKEPQKVSPGTAMPKYGFTNEEAKSLTMFMLSLTDERIVGYYSSKKLLPDVNFGITLFEEKGCAQCHTITGKGGKIAPDLKNIQMRRTTDWLYLHFKEPQIVSPGTIMPKYTFTDDQIKALTMFLFSLGKKEFVGYLRKPELSLTKEQQEIEAGRMVFEKYGCAGCHRENATGGMPNPNTHEGVTPNLIYVQEGYTKKQLKKFIKDGNIPEKKNKKGPEPPLYMPSWGKTIPDVELDKLAKYLFSLYPENEKE